MAILLSDHIHTSFSQSQIGNRQFLFMPQAGFEPALLRFLRPPPLPLGYCGHSIADRQSAIANSCNALGRIRTCTSRESQSRTLSEIGLPEPHWSPEGIEPSSPGCKPSMSQLDHTTAPFLSPCCGKGSNLQPRPSEGRALHPIELPQLNFASHQSQIGNRQFLAMPRAGFEPASR